MHFLNPKAFYIISVFLFLRSSPKKKKKNYLLVKGNRICTIIKKLYLLSTAVTSKCVKTSDTSEIKIQIKIDWL